MCAKNTKKLLVKFDVEFKAKRYLRREKKTDRGQKRKGWHTPRLSILSCD